jgi:uncharacterized membrane protein YhiD involved in acid resistance
MSQILRALQSGPEAAAPLDVGLRLVLALLLGGVVAWLYRVTREEQGESSFPPTLVLLSILIAMVTQVIGDNVARAFSLVGALSIVRFRTVVRDTEDTAFVIFAVAVGMAVGAHNLVVAILGITVVAAAAFVMRRPLKVAAHRTAVYSLTIRLPVEAEGSTLLDPVLSRHTEWSDLHGVATARQGLAVEYSYEIRLKPRQSAEDFVKALLRVEGVQSVDLQRHAEDAI